MSIMVTGIGTCEYNEPPQFVPPTPAAGSTICTQSNSTVIFIVSAQDFTYGNESQPVEIETTALPIGANVSSTTGKLDSASAYLLLIISGINPASVTFMWTPTVQQAGVTLICFQAKDSHHAVSVPNCVSIWVDKGCLSSCAVISTHCLL